MFDLQKVNSGKRFLAFLLDSIFFSILAVGCAFLLSVAFQYGEANTAYNQHMADYEEEHHISLRLTKEEYDELSEEEQTAWRELYESYFGDPAVAVLQKDLVTKIFLISALSLLFSFLVLEFTVPLFLGNGQTFGKKIFSVAVMRNCAVKLDGVTLFVRAIFGKFLFETAFPVLIFLLVLLGIFQVELLLFPILLLIAQLVSFFLHQSHGLLHDRMADTVVVDLDSQMIFDSLEAKDAYQKNNSL